MTCPVCKTERIVLVRPLRCVNNHPLVLRRNERTSAAMLEYQEGADDEATA